MPHRLLLVEDDNALSGALSRGLSEEGFAVESVADGPAALAALQTRGVDIAILDLRLPGLDGLEVLRRARADGVTTPILVLTARDSTEDRVRGLNAGADDYLVKPFELSELLARLHALLRRPPLKPTPTKVGRLEVDPLRHRVLHDGKAIDLSNKQFALLDLFMRAPGEVFTRERILKEVWGYDFDPGTNVVDVHIAALRQRLDAAGVATPVIRTVRGVGYSLEESATP